MPQLPFRLALWAVGLMWLLPFLSFHHLLPIPSFYGEWVAAALGLAASAVLLRREIWQPFQLPRVALLPVVLVGFILLQLLMGKIAFPQQALLGMLYLLWAMLLMVVGHRLRQSLGWENFAVTLAWCLVAGGLLSAAITLVQTLGWQGWWLIPKRMAQGYGNLGQPNHFADYLALGLASLLFLRLKGRIPAWLAAALLGIFLGMLALSGSRSSWLYLIALTVLGAWHSRASGQRSLLLACLWLLPAFWFLQHALPWLGSLSGGPGVVMPNERLFREVSGVDMRLQIWQQAWHMFVSSPWLGVGFGQFDWNSFAMMDRFQGGTIEPSEHAHNLLLHLMAELGGLAALTSVGLLAGWLLRAVRGEVSPERWWMLSLLAVLGIHSFLEYPLWYTYFLSIFAVLLGAGEQQALALQLQRVGRPALAAMLVMGTIGLANLAQAYGTLERWMVQGMQGQVKDHDLPAMTRDLLRIHHDSLLSPYVELVLATSIEPTPQLLDDKLKLSLSAQHFSPIRLLVYRHVVLLALKGDHEAALVQLRRAARAYPADVPQFTRDLRVLENRTPGVYDYLLNEIATMAKEQS